MFFLFFRSIVTPSVQSHDKQLTGPDDLQLSLDEEFVHHLLLLDMFVIQIKEVKVGLVKQINFI